MSYERYITSKGLIWYHDSARVITSPHAVFLEVINASHGCVLMPDRWWAFRNDGSLKLYERSFNVTGWAKVTLAQLTELTLQYGELPLDIHSRFREELSNLFSGNYVESIYAHYTLDKL